MECIKWEEIGLLYTSGELSTDQKNSYREHLAVCEYCTTELSAYEQEKTGLYSERILGEEPSAAVDAEILRVCGRVRSQVTGSSFVFVLARKSVAALLLVALGFGGGLYVAYNVQDANNIAVAKSQAVPQSPIVAQNQGLPVSDSASDTLKDANRRPFSQRQGNLSSQGVVPVDLQK